MAAETGYKILIADDDVALASVVADQLRAQGYRVELSHDGLSAMESIITWKPHLVILDHDMPGLDGRTVCGRLRKSFVTVKVMMVTGANQVGDRVAGLDAGADDYVCKPFEMDELLARVRAHLRDVPLIVDEARTAEGLQIRVLGSFQMLWQGTEISAILWNRRQPLLLLKLLLLQYNRPVLSDVLEEAIWPELDAERARRSLHVAVQRLRTGLRKLGPQRVQTCPGGYAFRLQAEDDLDLARLDALIARLNERLTVDNLRALAATYEGTLFPEERYADAFEAPRAQLDAAVVELLSRGALHCKKAGDDTARLLLTRLADLDPTREDSALDLADYLVGEGDVKGAEAVLSRVRDALASELDVKPGPRWTQLWQRVRRVEA